MEGTQLVPTAELTAWYTRKQPLTCGPRSLLCGLLRCESKGETPFVFFRFLLGCDCVAEFDSCLHGLGNPGGNCSTSRHSVSLSGPNRAGLLNTGSGSRFHRTPAHPGPGGGLFPTPSTRDACVSSGSDILESPCRYPPAHGVHVVGEAPPRSPPTNPNQSKQAEMDSLRDERESLRADGRTGDELDEDVAQGSREVGSCDLLQHGAEGVDVGCLAGRVPGTRVQDVSPVQDQQEDMRLAGALRAAFLRAKAVGIQKEKGGWGRGRHTGTHTYTGTHTGTHMHMLTHTGRLRPEKQALCPACLNCNLRSSLSSNTPRCVTEPRGHSE